MRSRGLEGLLSCGRPKLVAFPNGVAQSTPMNGTPYLTVLPVFARLFAEDDRRQAMLAAAESVVARLLSTGLEPLFAIVGGSFLDLERADPKDLDLAIFYQMGEDGADAADLGALEQEYRQHDLDLRLFPYDASPALVAKLIGYFSILYSGPERAAPTVIIDLTASRAQPTFPPVSRAARAPDAAGCRPHAVVCEGRSDVAV